MKNEDLDTIIEKSLKTKIDFCLPVDFAQKVTMAVVRHEQWKSDLREYLLMTGVIIGLLSVAVGLYYYLDKQLILTVFSFVKSNAVMVMGTLFVLNFILLADKVLLPLLFNRVSKQ